MTPPQKDAADRLLDLFEDGMDLVVDALDAVRGYVDARKWARGVVGFAMLAMFLPLGLLARGLRKIGARA